MHELLVDGADEFDRDDVEPVGKETKLTGLQILATQETRHLVKVPGGGDRLRGRRKHVAVEGVSQPREQKTGGSGVAQGLRKVFVSAQLHQAAARHDIPVDQVLRKDAPADQGLRLAPVESRLNQLVFEATQVTQQAAVNAGLPTDAILQSPELSRLHRQPAGERVKARQLRIKTPESFEEVGFRVAGSGCAEAVVEIDPLRRDEPQQRCEPLIPDLLLPRGDRSFLRIVGIVDVLEVNGETGPGATAVRAGVAAPPGVRVERRQPDTCAGTGERHAGRCAGAIREIARGLEDLAERFSDHLSLPYRGNEERPTPFRPAFRAVNDRILHTYSTRRT